MPINLTSAGEEFSKLQKNTEKTDKIPEPKKKPGHRPKSKDKLREQVISAKKKIEGGATAVGKYSRMKKKIRADNNRIHGVHSKFIFYRQKPNKKSLNLLNNLTKQEEEQKNYSKKQKEKLKRQ